VSRANISFVRLIMPASIFFAEFEHLGCVERRCRNPVPQNIQDGDVRRFPLFLVKRTGDGRKQIFDDYILDG